MSDGTNSIPSVKVTVHLETVINCLSYHILLSHSNSICQRDLCDHWHWAKAQIQGSDHRGISHNPPFIRHSPDAASDDDQLWLVLAIFSNGLPVPERSDAVEASGTAVAR